MSKKRKALSHAEIWDDSALVDSWNEALAEYKYYHSLHALGEKVEDVVREAEAAENGEADGGIEEMDGEDDAMAGREEYDEAEEGEWEEGDDAGDAGAGGAAKAEIGDESHAQPKSMPALAGVPQAVTGNMQDETMKNLMMSWYYAGYYTGFHEGRQQGLQDKGGTPLIGDPAMSRAKGGE